MAKQVHLCPGCWKEDQLKKKKKSEIWKEYERRVQIAYQIVVLVLELYRFPHLRLRDEPNSCEEKNSYTPSPADPISPAIPFLTCESIYGYCFI